MKIELIISFLEFWSAVSRFRSLCDGDNDARDAVILEVCHNIAGSRIFVTRRNGRNDREIFLPLNRNGRMIIDGLAEDGPTGCPIRDDLNAPGDDVKRTAAFQ